jgi:hypothetical protein
LALHEVGHALGFKHTEEHDSVMLPTVRLELSDSGLAPIEIERLGKAYKLRESSFIKPLVAGVN